MIRYKSKKILALILSGVLIAGSVPVTSNAAEQSGESTEEYAESTDGQYTDSTEENRAAGKDTPEESTDEESKPESSAAHTDEESKPEESTVEGSTDEENAAEENTNEENAAEENSTKENTTEINSSEESTASETTENVTETETDTTETETDTKETETESETETEETEEDFKVLLSDRQIAETDNILSKFNTSFENVGDGGILHWWNHLTNGANDKLTQKEYGEESKPSEYCGNFYLEAHPNTDINANKGESGAYICSNEIADVIKPEVTYKFTYFAKLADGMDSGTVNLEVKSVGENWSTVKDAKITLDSEVELDSRQWKQVSGTFQLPAHAERKEVAVRFVASENLVFCIDDLRVATVEGVEDDSQISNKDNILSKFNTSFENVGDGGILHWWNHLTNGANDKLTQKEYGEESKPSEYCGNFYLEAHPNTDINANKGESGAYICSNEIADVIKPEVTYKFTYFAKLADGMDSGTVNLEVKSVGENWSTVKDAKITLDSEVELDSRQWKQVSGTFQLPAHAERKEVAVRFVASENLSFCIDDLRVAASDKGDVEYSDNLVKNPYFAESDLSMWQKEKGEASISTATADKAIFDDIATYGVIENRKSNYDCFAQDMTGILKSGSSYEYSFYVKLDAEDYKDAPEKQREVCFGPYVTVEGERTYWDSNSSGVLDDGCSKKIPAGKWVKFEGTFNPKFEGEADELIIRILEQGTDNGSGAGIKGKYYVTGVSIHEVKKPIKEIEWDIPNLKDTVSSNDKGIGTDAYTGALLTVSDLSDQPLMDLVQKHFNAVTFENEMKMDAMFGYHDNNNSAPGFDTITWTRADGTEMKDYKVPQLNYSGADKILDALKEWNTNHPDSVIKVRGHVLVWHSQAPEWFFHEDWDINKPDASAEVMDARQEWYIKTVLEHYTGDSSPYKGMFYGWDVVNEAVSDSSGDYRHEDEKSSWWRVYKSEDFIVNAFRYANHYAPSDLELYYNDYNECMGNKVSGIEKLLREVKSHETDEKLPTRIDAMGMQSHHTISSPTVSQIRDAAVRYGKIVGKIQLTELDLKASDDFDGTDATLQNEYTKQAYRYKEIYDVMREVDAMEDIDVNGITVWGVIDGNSWLQDSSDVGGGADGSKKQVPLLFDDDYKAKPSFYAFVNADKLEPYIRSVTVMQAADDNPYVNGKSYEIQGINAKFIPVWSDTELKVQVTVPDTTADAGDEVTLYIDWDKSDNAEITEMTRAKSHEQEDGSGYVAEFTVPRECTTAMNFSMDVVVSDNGELYAFNDMTMNQGTSSKYYASAITKPYMTIAKVGKDVIKVDGEQEAAWEQAKEVQFQIRTGTTQAAASAKLLWDEQYLYVLATVTDAALDKTSSQVHERDSVEVFIDENNHKSDSYEADDKQYRIDYENEQSYNGDNCNAENVVSKTTVTDKGYLVEAAFKWTEITPEIGNKIGIDLQINDAESGKRIGTVSWYDESGQGWSSPSVFGTATLGDLIKTPDPEEPDVREELNNLISDCETFIKDSKEEDYTQETWKIFIEAFETAKQVQNDENAAPEAIQAAYEELIKAKEGLLPYIITTDGLQSLIGECESLKQDNYTSESWENFDNALKNAKDIISKPDVTQAEIEEAYKKLVEARTALKQIETETSEQKELKGLIAECETLNKDDYTADSWSSFVKALEDAKNVLEKPDATSEDVQKTLAALKEAKAGLEKQEESKPVDKEPLKELLSRCEELNPNDYTMDSWVAYEKVLAEARAVLENEAAVQEDVQNIITRLSEALSQLKEREGLWALEIADVTYTGKALKPPVTVYDGKTLLTLGRDYTVSYKKNTKPTEQAEAVIKGKGNYAGSTTKKFKIVPKNIADEDILIPNLYVKAPKAGKSVTVAPVVTRNGKKLTKKDFAVDSIQDNAGSKVDRVTQPGTYTVTVKGVDANGYTGTKEIQLVVLNGSQVLMSAVKVTGIQNKAYTGDKVVPEFTVKYGQETLEADKDYKVFCDSIEVGTATAVIKGIGEKYVGEKTVTFKITGTVLKPANVQLENASNLYYTGNAIEPVVKISGAEQNRDFTVSYDKNVKAGTATVTVKGIGKYTGTVKKTFKIAPFDIQQNPEGKLSYQTAGMEVPYMKGGSKLKASDLKAVFNGKNLVEGTDYTLVYSGNKKLGTATVKIKGKGNFKGTTAPVSFTIHTQDLAKLTNVIISDVANKNARKYTNVSLTIKDFDEKPLKKGTDYSVTFTKTDGTTPITETPKAGNVIRATIEGNNCYTGEIYKDFRIIDDSADISKAKVEVTPQYYTGKEITLSEINPVTGEQQIFVTINVGGEKKTLREGTDYEIVKHGYTKNINKGTGKMTIRGINQYGGIQTVSFKITAQALDHVEWYENLYKSSMSGIMKILSNKSN